MKKVSSLFWNSGIKVSLKSPLTSSKKNIENLFKEFGFILFRDSKFDIINIKKFGCLQITKTGLQILKNELHFNYKEIELKQTKIIKNKKEKFITNVEDSDLGLLASLKELRLD